MALLALYLMLRSLGTLRGKLSPRSVSQGSKALVVVTDISQLDLSRIGRPPVHPVPDYSGDDVVQDLSAYRILKERAEVSRYPRG